VHEPNVESSRNYGGKGGFPGLDVLNKIDPSNRTGTEGCMGLAAGEFDAAAKEVTLCVCAAYCRPASYLRGVEG
jgi:hypothetical protein